jgi:hypothetical protein
MINQDQLLSAVRSILAAVGGWAIGKGYITQDQLTLIGGVLASLIPLVWGIAMHTQSATVNAAANQPGVKTIVLTSSSAADAHPSDKVVGPSGK